MPIGTSDGEHFDDRFSQEIAGLQSHIPMPRPRPDDAPDMGLEEATATGLPGTRKEISSHPIFKQEDQKSTSFMEDRRDSPNSTFGQRDPFKTAGQNLEARDIGYTSKERTYSGKPVSPGEAKSWDMYVNQDLSRQEKDSLSQQAGINDIPINPNLKNVINSPSVVKALDDGNIDRSHEVPYIAGASKGNDDHTTHVDKDVPSSVTISGKTFDPAIPLHIHEQVEKQVMQKLISDGHSNEKAYEIAHHEYAEPAEDLWYKTHGIDVDEMNKFWNKIDYKTEKDKGDYPPDLYSKPYPHDQVKGIRHEPLGKESPDVEWKTNTPVNLK